MPASAPTAPFSSLRASIKPPTPKDTSEGKPVGVTSGVIISKSMMGQRTDDENVPADWKSQAGSRLRLGTLTSAPGGRGRLARGRRARGAAFS